jgi:hypothetical protein
MYHSVTAKFNHLSSFIAPRAGHGGSRHHGGNLEDFGLSPAQAKKKKILRPPTSTNGCCGGAHSNPSYLAVKACHRVKKDTISKRPSAKRAGGMTQVVEWLPSKPEALSSTKPQHQKKKREIILPVR